MLDAVTNGTIANQVLKLPAFAQQAALNVMGVQRTVDQLKLGGYKIE